MQNRVLTVCCLVTIILIIVACGAPAPGEPTIQMGTHAATGEASHAATGVATGAAVPAATRAATSAATAAPTAAR
jgi:hypothetical protein